MTDPDYRALCAELTDDLEEWVDGYLINDPADEHTSASFERINRARALLAEADGPAVPDGREPASVALQPSDGELLATFNQAVADFPPRHPEAKVMNVVEYSLALELRKARAILARWGRPAAAPVAKPGEVAQVAIELQELAESCGTLAMGRVQRLLTRAATLLQPVPEPGEVGDLVEFLQRHGTAQEAADTHWAKPLLRAATLLQQQAAPVTAPVPVSERLQGPSANALPTPEAL